MKVPLILTPKGAISLIIRPIAAAVNGDSFQYKRLLIMPQLLATPTFARKYRTLASETFRDYSYTISHPLSTRKNLQSDPFAITKTWHQMGLEILRSLAGDLKYTLYKVNE